MPVGVVLLGGFAVVVDGRHVTVPPQSRRLLAYLCVVHRPPIVHERQALAERLWPDLRPGRALAALRSAVYRLRAAGPGLLLASPSTVGLGHGVRVDLHDCARLADRLLGAQHVDPADPSADDLPHVPPDVVRSLSQELLPGWDEPWLDVERERFRQLSLHALEALSRRLSDEGRHARAIDAALLALTADPLHEPANAALVEAYAAGGCLAAAHRHVHDFTHLLARELGVRPSRTFASSVARLAPQLPPVGPGPSSPRRRR